MAPHSSILTWKIPWTEEPDRLQSMGSLRVRHDWATSLSLFTFMHWRRKWQPTHVLTWRIPDTRKPGGLLSMGLHRVGHDWSDLTAACRATQDGQVMVESSDKTWSTGESNGKSLQYSCLENPMDSMKRQKHRTMRDELQTPRIGRCPICYWRSVEK